MLNKVFKALNDPTRREILQILKNKDCNVTDLLAHFDISGASLSHHLEQLHNANLVTKEKKGQFVIYSINTTVLDDLMNWVIRLNAK